MLVLGLDAYSNDKFIQKRVKLKSLKKDPPGIIGRKLVNKYASEPI